MRILFLTPWYPDEESTNHGIFIQDQAIALAKTHQIMVISSKVDYSTFAFRDYNVKESSNSGVREIRLTIKKSLPFYNQINYLAISRDVALQYAIDFKPEVIQGNIGYPGAYWARNVAKALNVPYLVFEHTKIENNFRSLWHKRITLLGLTRAARVVTVSSWAASGMERWIGHVAVVPNIVKVNLFSINNRTRSNKLNIGFLGALFSDKHTKGLDVLLNGLKRAQFEFHLHIGGGGEMLKYYVDLAQELGQATRCTFYGQIKPYEVPAFMNKLDFFVCASRVESFGIALLEAMACGLPVLSTDCGGPKDFVNRTNGILVDKENVGALAIGLNQMASSLTSFSPDKIRSFVVHNYSPEAFVNRIEKIYEEIMI